MSRQSELAALGRVSDTSALSNRNLIINGAMQVAQRGTSHTSQGYGSLDRFYLALSGGAATMSQQTLTLGQTDIPSQFRKYLRIAASSGNNNLGLAYRIEGVDTAEGAYVLTFYAKGTNPAGGNFAVKVNQVFGSGGSSQVTGSEIPFTLTTSWQRFEVPITLPSLSGKTIGASSYIEINILQPFGDTGTAAWTLDLTGIQLEVGDTATPFEHRSYGDELARCQRYYQRWEETGSTFLIAHGYAASSTIAQYDFRFHGEMRTSPTMSSGGNTNAFQFGSNVQQSYESSVPLFELTYKDRTRLRDNTFSSLTAGSATFAYMISGNGGYIQADAEL